MQTSNYGVVKYFQGNQPNCIYKHWNNELSKKNRIHRHHFQRFLLKRGNFSH